MGWEKAETLLADIAYFNSLVCPDIFTLRFSSKPYLHDIGSKKGPNPVVQPERYIDTTVK
jgi:hypothetical protein